MEVPAACAGPGWAAAGKIPRVKVAAPAQPQPEKEGHHSERSDHGPNMIPPNNRLCLVLGLHSDSIYIPTIVHRKY